MQGTSHARTMVVSGPFPGVDVWVCRVYGTIGNKDMGCLRGRNILPSRSRSQSSTMKGTFLLQY